MTEYNSATGRPVDSNPAASGPKTPGVSASLNAFIASHRKATGKRATDSERKGRTQQLKLKGVEEKDDDFGAPLDPARLAAYLPKDKLDK